VCVCRGGRDDMGWVGTTEMVLVGIEGLAVWRFAMPMARRLASRLRTKSGVKLLPPVALLTRTLGGTLSVIQGSSGFRQPYNNQGIST